MNTELKKLSRIIIKEESCKIISGQENLQGFSLPADNFIFEKELNKELDINFTGVERDTEIYNRGKPIADSLGFEYKNETVTEYFKRTYKKFNLIWLDYCSSFNIKTVQEIRRVLNPDNFDLTESNAIFGVTLSGRRDPQIKIVTEFLKIPYDNLENREFARLSGVPLLLMHYMEQWNSGLELVPLRHIKYHDVSIDSKRTPMHLHLFEVQKVCDNTYRKYGLGQSSVLKHSKFSNVSDFNRSQIIANINLG